MGNLNAKTPCVKFVGHVPEWVRLTSYKGVQIVFFWGEEKKKERILSLNRKSIAKICILKQNTPLKKSALF